MTIYGIGGTGEQLPYEHKGTAMTEQEVKEQIADIIREGPKLSAFDVAGQIFVLIKQQGYMRLDPDQSLPSVRNAVNKSYNDYMLGQEDMLKANFRKIEKEDQGTREYLLKEA